MYGTAGFPSPLPPVASVADTVQAFAAGQRSLAAARNRAVLIQGAQTGPVTPAALTAPTGAVVASIVLTPKASGLFSYYFNLTYTLSGAGGAVGAVAAYQGATGGNTGGTVTNGIRWESGAIVAPSGGAFAFSGGSCSQTDPAGDLTQTMMIVGVIPLTLGVAGILVFQVTSAQNLASMSLDCGAQELP